MKKLLILAAAAGLSSSIAFGAACAVGNNLLAPYNGNSNTAPSFSGTSGAPLVNGGVDFGCTVAPLTFSNFSYDLDLGSFQTAGPDVPISGLPPIANGAALEFNPNLTNGSDLLLEFQVSGGLSGAFLQATIGGTGAVNETVCSVFESTGICPTADVYAILNVNAGGDTVTTPTGSICFANAGCSSSTTGGVAVIIFPSQTQVWIDKDISSGSANFSEVEQGFVTPEPMTLSLMGLGLLGIGLARRKFKQ
jgi:hypothetical protein